MIHKHTAIHMYKFYNLAELDRNPLVGHVEHICFRRKALAEGDRSSILIEAPSPAFHQTRAQCEACEAIMTMKSKIIKFSQSQNNREKYLKPMP